MADNLGQQSEDARSLYDQLRGVTSELKNQDTILKKSRKAFRDITGIAESLRQNEEEVIRLSDAELGKLSEKLAKQRDILANEVANLAKKFDISSENVHQILPYQLVSYKY